MADDLRTLASTAPEVMAPAQRLVWLDDQLAALASYGNDEPGDPRAVALRAERDQMLAETAAAREQAAPARRRAGRRAV